MFSQAGGVPTWFCCSRHKCSKQECVLRADSSGADQHVSCCRWSLAPSDATAYYIATGCAGCTSLFGLSQRCIHNSIYFVLLFGSETETLRGGSRSGEQKFMERRHVRPRFGHSALGTQLPSTPCSPKHAVYKSCLAGGLLDLGRCSPASPRQRAQPERAGGGRWLSQRSTCGER